jgi:hypothetical protein
MHTPFRDRRKKRELRVAYILLAFRPNRIAFSIATAYVRSTFLFSLHTNVTDTSAREGVHGLVSRSTFLINF